MERQPNTPRWNLKRNEIQTVTAYCGSADGVHPEYFEAAADLGRLLAHAGVRLVYGAGKTGVMGALAEGALRAGGEVVGLVPENLNLPELVHAGLSALEVFPNIQARKARMSAMADAFISLPGGYGTMDELFETLTWAQIGLHDKPVGLLNTRGFYDPILAAIRHMDAENFIYASHLVKLTSDASPARLLEKLLAFPA